MGDLDGKVAIITGAGNGLGREHALYLGGMGARVVVNELGGSPEREAPANAVVEEIKAAGGEAYTHFGDCADWNGTQEMFDKALKTYGDVNIMINNAGFLNDGMIFNMDEAQFDSVVRVHLKGHFCGIQHAAKYWREKGKASGEPVYGRLISTASEAFLFGSAGQPNYAAAKAGIVALTMATAQSLIKYGVTANVICPRARTDMTAGGITGKMFAKPEEGFDLFGPQNVAPLVGYLVSPAAANVSGEVFIVWGKRVTVVERPKIDQHIDKAGDGMWTQKELQDALGARFEKSTPVKDGFSVPPQ